MCQPTGTESARAGREAIFLTHFSDLNAILPVPHSRLSPFSVLTTGMCAYEFYEQSIVFLFHMRCDLIEIIANLYPADRDPLSKTIHAYLHPTRVLGRGAASEDLRDDV
jgi:hypothetical protein